MNKSEVENQDKEIIIEKLILKIKEYAKGRKSNVIRGAETPILAALLLQKYGIGIIEATAIIYDSPRITDQLYRILDEEVFQIDPDWEEHGRKRWEKRPANLNFNGYEDGQREVILDVCRYMDRGEDREKLKTYLLEEYKHL